MSYIGNIKQICRRRLPKSIERAKLVGFVILFVGAQTNIHAADIGIPPPPPVYNWTGLYVGGDAGYQRANASATVTFGSLTSSAQEGVQGAIGSGILGWNWEIPSWWNAGAMLIGTELDIIGSARKQSQVTAVGVEAFSDSLRIPWLSTLRGRFGVPLGPGGAWLVYGTAGVGFGRFESASILSGPVSTALNGTIYRSAWVAGAGVEYAIARYWTWKAEYLYVDTGSVTNATPTLAPGISLTTGRITEGLFRTGFNYHF
jgi:outer membrane immunogenic protein